eukprot:GHVT01061726.1.p3 GENE.GHVT01061726.1~~GHVT01061726.1.p3  ORF type:complete len:114 (+),score=14.78 GHVT01061726.1:389-730(+)
MPHFIRPSSNRLPNSTSMRQKLHAPIGIICQPLAPTPPGYAEIASVNFGNGQTHPRRRALGPTRRKTQPETTHTPWNGMSGMAPKSHRHTVEWNVWNGTQKPQTHRGMECPEW